MSKHFALLLTPVLLASTLALLVCGCASRASDDFVAASIRVYRDHQGTPLGEIEGSFSISDPGEMERLLSHFPGVGEGKRGGTPAAWEADVSIQLTRQSGSTLEVSSNYAYWGEGNGNWRVDTDLRAYILDMLEKAN